MQRSVHAGAFSASESVRMAFDFRLGMTHLYVAERQLGTYLRTIELSEDMFLAKVIRRNSRNLRSAHRRGSAQDRRSEAARLKPSGDRHVIMSTP